MLVIDFATRRRMRLNGSAEYGRTAPFISTLGKYTPIAQSTFRRGCGRTETLTRAQPRRSGGNYLTKRQQRWIGEADTFFIASGHPYGGLDASHRGGSADSSGWWMGACSSGPIIPAT